MANDDSWTQTPIRLALKKLGVNIHHLKRNRLRKDPDTGAQGLSIPHEDLLTYKETPVRRDIDEARDAAALITRIDFDDAAVIFWPGANFEEYFK